MGEMVFIMGRHNSDPKIPSIFIVGTNLYTFAIVIYAQEDGKWGLPQPQVENSLIIAITVGLGQVRLGQVRLGQVRLGQVRLGQVRLGCFIMGEMVFIMGRHNSDPKIPSIFIVGTNLYTFAIVIYAQEDGKWGLPQPQVKNSLIIAITVLELFLEGAFVYYQEMFRGGK